MTIAAKRKLALALVSGCTLLAAMSQAQAASTWGINASACQAAIGTNLGTTVGNSAKCAATDGDTNGLTMWAYGAGAVRNTSGAVTGATGTYQDAQLAAMSSDGVAVKSAYEIATNTGSPQHALDNSPTNGAPDLILLKFDTAVALDKVTIGWRQNDADFTLMAYTGTFGAGLNDGQKADALVVGKSASTLTAGAGWALIEDSGANGFDPGPAANYSSGTNVTRTVNDGDAAGGKKDVVSSWWLISAYNSNFGGGATFDTNNDYIKLLTFASKDVTTNQAPEPTSLALAGVALAGILGVRRRRAAQG
ncbi:exosortase-dependent surface protein XDP1 [Roseateles sp. LYH14W]|uniref:Exosortase-dependent surface protein XDP1 n=1 Tax=Pelomonas parva TaxID=3299032 RepID=A0ABW7F3W4_9BURK